MAIFKALTFDGVNSLDYGIYITGEAVYNAPERAVEMVNIPGKNGALALDQGRFENIEVTYHAGCFADSQSNFADKVMRFRNALASRYTYKRLTDEYHPDEYRLGLYKSGLDVDAVRYGTAGEFNITFDCKPQRFLVDGDRAISPTEWSDVQTGSGELVTIESDGSLAVKSLEVSLFPIQDLNGYDHPWVGGAGKNKLDLTSITPTRAENGITFTVNADGTINATGTATARSQIYWPIPKAIAQTFGGMILNGCVSQTGVRLVLEDAGMPYTSYAEDAGSGATIDASIVSMPTDNANLIFRVASGTTLNNVTIKPMIRLASVSDATYEPYSNICPISGRTSVDTIVSPTTSATDGQTYTTSLGRTVYGGTLDVVSGVLTVDRAYHVIGNTKVASAMAYKSGYAKAYIGNELSPSAESGTVTDLISNMFVGKNIYSLAASGMYIYNSGVNIALSVPFSAIDGYSDIGNNTNYVEAVTKFLTDNQVQIVYPLATPQTYQLTPQQIDLLLGINHLWSDGEITVTYGVHPYYNPTPFDAKPLIKVTGRGTLGIGEYILTITGTASQTLYIDCETMEIYTLEGTVPTGASSLVSINKNDFPVLEPGTNYISVGSGITAVTITPRWWRI